MRRSSVSYRGDAFLKAVVVVGASLFLGACKAGDDAGGEAATSAAPFPAVSLTRVASGFDEPLLVTHAGDGSGRLFVVERGGMIRIVRNGKVEPTPFLDIAERVRTNGSEQGLLGLAFPPDYAQRKHFYVHYTAKSGVGDTLVARYQVGANPAVADPSSEEVLLRHAQPYANHNGGHLAFGPDGYLYIGLGDGGSGGDPQGNGQNPRTLLGKMLRLDVESGAKPYAIPRDNPFGNEIWALGLRNPWRFSFDRATGDLYIADVGQNAYEEVNFQPAASRGGENYGWNVREGMHCFRGATCDRKGLTDPVAEYRNGSGNCSITGGHVYRGAQYPSLAGVYIYGDFCSGQLWALRRSKDGWQNARLLESGLRLSSFGEDEAGNVYLVDYGKGEVHRLSVR